MACIEKTSVLHVDSEREEGEIVDELDELSDISSEEEYLLRQRLHVLEKYNNVLERKAKGSPGRTIGCKYMKHVALPDLSDISATELDEISSIKYKNAKVKNFDSQSKHKRRKETNVTIKQKEHKKKCHSKKKPEKKVLKNESSDESDDEFRNRRRKLANAVKINKPNSDVSTLRDRLQNMLCVSKNDIQNHGTQEVKVSPDINSFNTSSTNPSTPKLENVIHVTDDMLKDTVDGIAVVQENNLENANIKSSEVTECIHNSETDKTLEESEQKKSIADSDEDLELLRQNALQTKTKTAQQEIVAQKKSFSDDEDSDTFELRLICLRSALLKQAIERKREQKLIKRISLSQSIHNDIITEEIAGKVDSDNNTDIESVDMDIGSDAEDKVKDISNHRIDVNVEQNDDKVTENVDIPISIPKEDEIEEDEDVLRAKLLTSLSKNFPNLIHPNLFSGENTKIDEPKQIDTTKSSSKKEENKFIINVAESDSEEEHEATENLKKMHMKLADQVDFQQKLDMFLKSTRLEVEKKQEPETNQDPAVQKPQEKFVPKALTHLPKSEQIEYQNLVKRMAELEKIKRARQASMNILNKQEHLKDTLKPRNVSIDTELVNKRLDEQIASSRKKIAEEAAEMLKLKEEGKKLIQKHKIVSTELKNISTAITLNKRKQKAAQLRLTKTRTQHQMLLKSSTIKHSITNDHISHAALQINNTFSTMKLQKENNPTQKDYRNPLMQKSLKISVVNDLKLDETVTNDRLSVKFDIGGNMRVVKVPKDFDSVNSEETRAEDKCTNPAQIPRDASLTVQIKVNKGHGDEDTVDKKTNDYESPLLALGDATWEEDPNGVLCPFDVGGNCKDPDCKFLHPKTLHTIQ